MKRWLRPDMTEKLFTGTLSKNEKKRKRLSHVVRKPTMWHWRPAKTSKDQPRHLPSHAFRTEKAGL